MHVLLFLGQERSGPHPVAASFACVGGPWRLRDGPGQCFQTYGLVARDASEEDEESAALSAVAEAAAAADAAEAAAASAAAGCGKLEITSLKS